MKKLFSILVAIFFTLIAASPAWSQTNPGALTPVKGGVVINFSELAKKELLNPPVIQERDMEEKEDDLTGIPTNLPVPKGSKVFQLTGNYVSKISSSIIESSQAASPPPIRSFNGLLDNSAVIPPDVAGAAGPNHLFENLNSQYRVLDKTGGTVSTLSLASFWSGLSGVGAPYSDPHIVFDSASGRWLACIIAQLTNGHYGIFLAASLTNDPTGSWYEYSLDTGPSTFLPDYPLLGYNKSWVVITTNDFKNLSFLRTRIVVYNKKKVIAGTLTSATTFFDSTLFTLSPAETMDPLERKEYLRADYNGNSGGAGYVRVCNISGKPGSPVYTRGSTIGVSQTWAEVSLDAPQLGSTHGINTGGTKMRAIMVRNGSIWATHTVYLPASSPNRASTDFWQINAKTNAVIQYGLIDDPTAALWTSYPSLSVTPAGHVLIGSTMVGSSIYASAIYSYRNAADAPNTFRTSYTYQAGGNSYYKTFGGTRNRWGDFSSTSLDPSDGTFWTLQEYAQVSVNKWGTSWANVDHPAAPQAAVKQVTSSVIDNAISVIPNPGKGNFTVNYQAAKQAEVSMTVYKLTGSVVYSKKVLVNEGMNHISLNIENVGNGNYKVVIQNGSETNQTQFIISK
jgi:hypothetical protein